MNTKLKKILLVLLIIIGIIFISGDYYVNDYYHAENVSDYLEGNENVSVIKTGNGLFLDGNGNDTALIFYPGAKVEYTAYVPLLMNLSNNGVDCFIVEMPFNIAFFGANSADDIITDTYDNWYISGHSLGGLMASSYASKNNDKVDGLILLASYPTDSVEVPVLSIYGSNDNVLNSENYEESKKLFKGNFSEVVIEGANHANYAFYGPQDGDANASISRDEQINKSVNEILNFVSK